MLKLDLWAHLVMNIRSPISFLLNLLSYSDPLISSLFFLLLGYSRDNVDSKSIALLEEFAKDPEPIVSQSCEVALSMLEYERSGKSFEVRAEQSSSG